MSRRKRRLPCDRSKLARGGVGINEPAKLSNFVSPNGTCSAEPVVMVDGPVKDGGRTIRGNGVGWEANEVRAIMACRGGGNSIGVGKSNNACTPTGS